MQSLLEDYLRLSMDNNTRSMKDIIDVYRKKYIRTVPSLPPRLPIQLGSEDDTFCRLSAIYRLEVERRGRQYQNDDDTINKLKRVAHWLYTSHKRGLILMGTMGNGKSTMLRSLHRLFESWGMFGDAQDIFEYYKTHIGEMRYWDEKFLIIDDLGLEPDKCFNYGEEYHPISRLLLHRYDRNLTTIIATNLGIDDIQAKYGDRVVERLFEMYDVLTYTNDSYRRKQI